MGNLNIDIIGGGPGKAPDYVDATGRQSLLVTQTELK